MASTRLTLVELSSINETRVLALPVVIRGRNEGRRAIGVRLPEVEGEAGDFGRSAGEPPG
jgi:hypothetical protein